MIRVIERMSVSQAGKYLGFFYRDFVTLNHFTSYIEFNITYVWQPRLFEGAAKHVLIDF